MLVIFMRASGQSSATALAGRYRACRAFGALAVNSCRLQAVFIGRRRAPQRRVGDDPHVDAGQPLEQAA